MDLITYAEYKNFASIDSNKENAQLDYLITAASSVITAYIGYGGNNPNDLGQYSETVVLRDNVMEYFLSRTDPIITRIEHWQRPSSPGIKPVVTEISPYDVIVEDTGKLELLSLRPVTGDRLTISLGYSTDIEADLKLATCLLVRYYYKEEFNKTAMTSGGQTVDFLDNNGLPRHVLAILDQYRLL